MSRQNVYSLWFVGFLYLNHNSLVRSYLQLGLKTSDLKKSMNVEGRLHPLRVISEKLYEITRNQELTNRRLYFRKHSNNIPDIEIITRYNNYTVIRANKIMTFLQKLMARFHNLSQSIAEREKVITTPATHLSRDVSSTNTRSETHGKKVRRSLRRFKRFSLGTMTSTESSVIPEGSLLVADAASSATYRKFGKSSIRRFNPRVASDILASTRTKSQVQRKKSRNPFSAISNKPTNELSKFRQKKAPSTNFQQDIKQQLGKKTTSVIENLYNRTLKQSGSFSISSVERGELKRATEQVTNNVDTLESKIISVLAKYSGLWSKSSDIVSKNLGKYRNLNLEASALIPLVELGSKKVNLKPLRSTSPQGKSLTGPKPKTGTASTSKPSIPKGESWGKQGQTGSRSRHTHLEIENTCGISRSQGSQRPSGPTVDIPDPVCECFSDGSCSSDRVPDFSPEAYAHCRGPSHGYTFVCCCLIRGRSFPLPDMRNAPPQNYALGNPHVTLPTPDIAPIPPPFHDYRERAYPNHYYGSFYG